MFHIVRAREAALGLLRESGLYACLPATAPRELMVALTRRRHAEEVISMAEFDLVRACKVPLTAGHGSGPICAHRAVIRTVCDREPVHVHGQVVSDCQLGELVAVEAELAVQELAGSTETLPVRRLTPEAYTLDENNTLHVWGRPTGLRLASRRAEVLLSLVAAGDQGLIAATDRDRKALARLRADWLQHLSGQVRDCLQCIPGRPGTPARYRLTMPSTSCVQKCPDK